MCFISKTKHLFQQIKRGHAIRDAPNNYDIWGAAVTEVEVDILTGEKNVVRADIVEDTGSSVNPAVDIGQVSEKKLLFVGEKNDEHFHKFVEKIHHYTMFNPKKGRSRGRVKKGRSRGRVKKGSLNLTILKIFINFFSIVSLRVCQS